MEAFDRIKKIGKGNFGDVLLVQRKSDQKLFALKRVDISNMELFTVDPLNEVKVLKSLDHPNIISTYDSFIHNNKLCILMEYADNADLALTIKEHKLANKFIKEETVLYQDFPLYLFLDSELVCLALHWSLIHPLLQNPPSGYQGLECLSFEEWNCNSFRNIFFQVKLGDFGISRTLENTLDLAQTSIGTPFYLSPEICQSRSYNHKIDIWMLGCVLYELCSQEKPFQGDSINAVVHKIMTGQPLRIPSHYSEFIADMIDWMLEKNPDNRPEISTVLQMPQMQKELFLELYKLNELYLSCKLKITFSVKLKELQVQEQREDESKQQLDPKKKPKVSQNSIHFLVEKARQQQQQQSPLYTKRSKSKIVTQPPTGHKESFDQGDISPTTLFVSSMKETENPAEIVMHQPSQPNSPHFKSQQNKQMSSNRIADHLFKVDFQRERQYTSMTDNSEQVKQRSYQRVISINTQLESNYVKKQQFTEAAEESGQQTLTLTKPNTVFMFAEQVLNPNAPTSPNRTILLTDFLKRKLGEEKFNNMRFLLENTPDPLNLLDNQRNIVQEILGENNMECIKIFKLLMSNSVTPQASHCRTKSAQRFNENAGGKKILNIHRLEQNQGEEEQGDTILDLLKDVEQMPGLDKKAMSSLGINPWFEISFKNLNNYQDQQ